MSRQERLSRRELRDKKNALRTYMAKTPILQLIEEGYEIRRYHEEDPKRRRLRRIMGTLWLIIGLSTAKGMITSGDTNELLTVFIGTFSMFYFITLQPDENKRNCVFITENGATHKEVTARRLLKEDELKEFLAVVEEIFL